jgi:formamidopyrimidine-DNA glycosylase
MPELPEVECFAKSIEKNYAGKKISQVNFYRENIRYKLPKSSIKKILEKQTLESACRHGKSLILKTEKGKILVGLGMSGCFQNESGPHEHIKISFSDNSTLRYLDARRFGFWITPSTEEWNKIFAVPDALNKHEVYKALLQESLKNTKLSIKQILLNQKIIGGVGNIYALEALFLSKISPIRTVSSCQKSELKLLAKQLKFILLKAIEFGGSSISSYRSFQGNKGQFQELHRVYQREGEVCLTVNCNTNILKIVQSGRSTYYCPSCQK